MVRREGRRSIAFVGGEEGPDAGAGPPGMRLPSTTSQAAGPAIVGLRRFPRPIVPAPTEAILHAAPAPTRVPKVPPPGTHEVLRHLHVRPDVALEAFATWWPRDLRVPGGRFVMTDRTRTGIEGRLHRLLRRPLRVELSLESYPPDRAAIRLTPEVRTRGWSPATDSWWRTAHALVDAGVVVVRAAATAP